MSQPEFPTVIDDNPELQPVPPQQTAVAVVAPPPSMAVGPCLTPEQAKVNAIADLTHSAYAKASQLSLTADEQKALQQDFPDEAFKPGAAGKEHLIYIEHAFLRDRFNQVFGPGQWALIPRSRWAEDFTTDKGKPASRVYVEAMLLVRGCFVAEAVGDMVYWKGNDSQNYGDAVEGAKTAALRRCAKELGVGLQAWKKDFGDGWWARKHNSQKRERSKMPQDEKGGIKVAGKSEKPTLPVAGKASGATIHPQATPETRQKLIEKLEALQNVEQPKIVEYFRALAMLLPNESLDDLPLRFVPVFHNEYNLLVKCILEFQNGNPARHAFAPHEETPAAKPVEVPRETAAVSPPSGALASEPWYTVIVPVPRKGMKRDEYLQNPDTIGSLYNLRHQKDEEGASARQRLWGFVTNYEAKGWTKTNGQQMPPSESDKKFRIALDQFADWFEKNHPGEKL